jgi:S-methylmethionine-dependent homocysteine/selenocysteine methylase
VLSRTQTTLASDTTATNQGTTIKSARKRLIKAIAEIVLNCLHGDISMKIYKREINAIS